MITLGITGRSGCGKSTVTAVFAAHGVPLVDADRISRRLNWEEVTARRP